MLGGVLGHSFLPPNLLALFAARDPIPYIPPVAKLSHEKPVRYCTGVANISTFLRIPPTHLQNRRWKQGMSGWKESAKRKGTGCV
ncbi:U1 small nuclear ribonucleoprotein 70 kDa [Orchesella cincta]|uniref:U1 small nuclear ribonucleoprotein 70 kDa n=1 Tax=Orchesella cincta TaxID=48709 RepID=A0A1D2M2X4_ORCCI|nr:U1 small nuclear ribonucleoprotein 70 kDa [Orchesella cincta]